MRSLLPISLVLLSASGLADTPTVRTDTGLVQGVLDDNVIVYKGIPFAGGAFRHGSASTPLYASGGLPKATGIVLINVNYRTGPLAFWLIPN